MAAPIAEEVPPPERSKSKRTEKAAKNRRVGQRIDRWHEPYMTGEELQAQIEAGVRFSCYIYNNEIIEVMGIQDLASPTDKSAQS